MSYEILDKRKNYEDEQVVSTTVDMRQNDPYTLLTRTISGDHSNTSNKKVVELVLELVNEETTPKAELVKNVKDLKEQIAEQQEIIQKSLESNRLLSSAFEELTYVVLEEVLPQLEEKEVIDATPIEDIAQPIEDEEVVE